MMFSLSGLWWHSGVGESGWDPAAPSSLSPWRSPACLLVMPGDRSFTTGAAGAPTLVSERQGEYLLFILSHYLQ